MGMLLVDMRQWDEVKALPVEALAGCTATLGRGIHTRETRQPPLRRCDGREEAAVVSAGGEGGWRESESARPPTATTHAPPPHLSIIIFIHEHTHAHSLTHVRGASPSLALLLVCACSPSAVLLQQIYAIIWAVSALGAVCSSDTCFRYRSFALS